MTAAADRALMDDWRAGLLDTREKHLLAHITTLDRHDELDAFRKALAAKGGVTDEIDAALRRRQNQIGE